MCVSNLEEVLGQDIESLRVVCDALQVWVLIQHGVVRVQEKVQGVLVQEVHLWTDTKIHGFLIGMQNQTHNMKSGLSEHLVESLHGEIDAAAGRGQSEVLL